MKSLTPLLLFLDFASADFNFNAFVNCANLSLNGAQCTNQELELTPTTQGSQAGSAWERTRQYVMPGFSAFFEYQFNPNQPNGGDGIAFLLQNSEYGTDALGKNGAGIGYGDSLAHGANGISESVAVELDNFLDSIMGDPDNMHISLHSVAHASNSAHENVSLALQEGIQGLQDNNTHWFYVRDARVANLSPLAGSGWNTTGPTQLFLSTSTPSLPLSLTAPTSFSRTT